MKVLSGNAAQEERGSRACGDDSSVVEKRRQIAQQLQEQREDDVLDLHTRHSAHYIDNAFSLVTANMAVVSLVLGCVYMSRPCEKPLAGFLIVLGLLAPFAACLPVLLRQWFYLHLRLKNVVTVVMLTASMLYIVWLLVGQRWAFASSTKTCDQDLSTAANVVVFVLYLMLLLYTAKVVWYLLARAPYTYRELFLSCFRDPYPNVLEMSDIDFDHLEAALARAPDDEENDGERKSKRKKNHTLMRLQRHHNELRQSVYHLFQSRAQSSTEQDGSALPQSSSPGLKPKAKNWTLDFSKSRRATSHPHSKRSRRGSKSSSAVIPTQIQAKRMEE